jgi:uncharacterized LabA/DUF88 family protein
MDGSNLFYQQKANFFFDVGKLVKKLTAGGTLVSAAWYIGDDLSANVERQIQEQSFRTWLRGNGIQVVSKPVKDIKDPEDPSKYIRKANLDVELAIDCTSMLGYVDWYILCTGDGDFVPLVQHLRANGKEVSIVSFRSSLASELLNVAGMHYVSLDSIKSDILKTAKTLN